MDSLDSMAKHLVYPRLKGCSLAMSDIMLTTLADDELGTVTGNT